MLESLYIKNFAIIDSVEINFQPNMTVLTGETGSGKSVIINAIGQLCGNRTSVDYIKKGKDKAVIEGVFTVSDKIEKMLDEYNIPRNDQQLVVSKTINSDGKAIIKLNYKNVTQIVLKNIVPHLIDIHSQFETHQLFNPKNHIEILDNFIGEPLNKLQEEYIIIYQKLKKLKNKYEALLKEELSDEQLDFYKSQLDEINEINFDDFDEEFLLAERKRLTDFEKDKHHYQTFYKYINGQNGVLSLFKEGLNELSFVENSEISNIYDQLYDMYYSLSDYIDQIQTIENEYDFNEEYFENIQSQYFIFNKLKRKYGQSVENIVNAKNELESKIKNFNNRDQIITTLKHDIDETSDAADKLANQMTQLRQKKANELEKQILNILQQLYLPQVKLKFIFKETQLTANGKDQITISVSTNINQELKPLQKIASGGELSRIMLAIKTVCNQFNGVDTIIFDEADTGVSGKVAESIGRIMKNISQNQQVICITHLAQVASFACHHYNIVKTEKNNDIEVNIKQLSEEESIMEIAKMISGVNVTKESLQHAKNLKKNNV